MGSYTLLDGSDYRSELCFRHVYFDNCPVNNEDGILQ